MSGDVSFSFQISNVPLEPATPAMWLVKRAKHGHEAMSLRNGRPYL